MGVSADEEVVVCPVDPYVDDDYFEALKKLAGLVKKGSANLSLLGIEPTYPSEKYGYIIPESKDNVSRVSTFKEKPDEATARKYINEGALWNAGVFAYKLSYVLNRAHELIDFKNYYDLFKKYDSLNFDPWGRSLWVIFTFLTPILHSHELIFYSLSEKKSLASFSDNPKRF